MFPTEEGDKTSEHDANLTLVKLEARRDAPSRRYRPRKKPMSREENQAISRRLELLSVGKLTKCSNKLDPFATLPISLNKFQEGLLRWYLFRYPFAQYGFNPHLFPHPVHTNFRISLGA